MLTTTAREIVEGTWEEISRQATRFNGHRLRVAILPDGESVKPEVRLKALNQWLTMPRPAVMPLLDDSRAAIYGEDKPRRFTCR